jgi:hypothetical protein
MPDETTFELASVELASVQFGAEPVAVFRFGYEPLRTARTAWSWKPGTRHCFGRRGRGQRLCEMVARSVSLCAAGSRWRGRRASPSLAARHERAHGASRPCRVFRRRSPPPSDSGRSASAVGTALHAPKPTSTKTLRIGPGPDARTNFLDPNGVGEIDLGSPLMRGRRTGRMRNPRVRETSAAVSESRPFSVLRAYGHGLPV